MGLVMNTLIEDQIKKHHEMQGELFADGEVPVGLKDHKYYKELYMHGEEMIEALATPLAQEVAEWCNEYAFENRLETGSIKTSMELTSITVWDYEGKVLVQCYYTKDDLDSQLIVLQQLAVRFPKVIFL